MDKVYTSILKWIDKEYWTNWMGLARSSMAFGTMLTLLFNSNNTLFFYGINNEVGLQCNNFNFFSLFCLLGEENLYFARIFSIIILVTVIIGVYPRFTCIFHWWVTFSFTSTSYVVDGGDQVASVLSLLLIPICITDKRKWHWNSELTKSNFYIKTVCFFSYLLILIQVSVIYFHAAVGKFKSEEWVNGTALYYWFKNPLFGINPTLEVLIKPILKSPILLTFSTWGVIIFELFLASCIFINNKWILKRMLILGIIFHSLIMIIHGLVSFNFSMCAALILYLIANNQNYDSKWFF